MLRCTWLFTVQGQTSAVVAHRLSTIRNVDCIAVIQEGEVVEHDSHEKLVAKPGGASARLVHLQTHLC